MELVETKSSRVSDVEKYEKNPFIEKLVIETRAKKLTVARGGMIIDQSTGEIEGVTEIAQVVSVEKEQFIKLFTKDLQIWFDLNKSGVKVFGALMTAVQQNSIGRDLVYLDHTSEIVKTQFGMSKQTFYRGLEELLKNGFIARHKSTGWFFINPAMFFNGDRARFIKEYRLKEDKKPIKKEENLELPNLEQPEA
jgi:predicted transcriptional regulator